MPRSGNTFDWGSIGTWANPQTSDAFSISGWNTLRDDLKAELTRSLANDGTGNMTGQFKADVGSVSAPGIAFNGTTNTGFYQISANEWGLSVGGTLRYTFKAEAVVADNNTTVLTSAAITAALAAISAFVPQYASQYVKNATFSSGGGAEILTAGKLGTTWLNSASPVGLTADLTNGTLTVSTTGKYQITISGAVNFASVAGASSNFQIAQYDNGVINSASQVKLLALTAGNTRYGFSSTCILSLGAAEVLTLRATGTSGDIYYISDLAWTVVRLA